MLCYRCGSYTPDGSRKCDVCGQPFSERRITGRAPALAVAGVPKHVAPYQPGALVAGRYRVAEPIAQGAAGWVLRARDEEVDVDVALKVIAANLLQTDDDRTRFLKTVRRARKVHHPNIARIYDEGREEHYVYYTMPFLEGLTLRKIIDLRTEKEQVFTFSETLPLIVQLAAAVDALARFGAHGAVRPASIIILPDILKVTALPHLRGLPRRPFVAAQSPGRGARYLAPEARRDDVTLDVRTDVYSLAVITGEMLTGRVFDGDMERWAPVARDLPLRVVTILARAMSEQPEARPENAQAMFSALIEASSVSAAGMGGASSALAGDTVGLDETAPDGFPVELSAPDPQPMREERTVRSGIPTPAPVPDEMSRSAEEGKRSVVPDHRQQTEPEMLAPWNTPVPLTKKRQTGVTRTKSVVDRSRAEEGKRYDRARQRRSSSGLMMAIAIVFAGATVAAAIWYHRQVVASATEIEEIDVGLRPRPDGTRPVETERSKQRSASQRTRPRAKRGRTDKPEQRERISKPAPARPEPAPKPKVIEVKPSLPPPEPPPPVASRRPVQPGGTRSSLTEPPPPPKVAAVAPAPAAPPAPPPMISACSAGMIKIAAGRFEMGSRGSDPLRGFGDLPARTEEVAAYCIDIYEYPNQRGRTPTANVSWNKAKSLCERRGKRLCTEAEWERACKGPRNLKFPIGNRFDVQACNAGGEGRKPGSAGGFPRCRSAYGVVDMSGNVAEWTAARWSAEIPDRVIKGGSADQAYYTARCAARANEAANAKDDGIGFRCCKGLN